MINTFEILNERAKELYCLYAIHELVREESVNPEFIFSKLLDIIPAAWQYSTICEARIIYQDKEHKREDFIETEWEQSADLIISGNVIGKIQVYYTQFVRYNHNESQFIPEEQKLLNTIASCISNYLFCQRLKNEIKFQDSSCGNFEDLYNLKVIARQDSDEHWKWRYKMAEKISEKLDLKRFGVKAIYLIGSTKNANAGPASDIDLMLHFQGTETQRIELTAWIQGWSLCLAEINFMKTECILPDGLIDLHIITDKEIAKNDSYASMIGAVDNRARLLKK